MTVILLAAGLSERMGRNKLLLPFKGKAILSATLETILSCTNNVIVVTGYERDRTEALVSDYPVRIVYAHDYLKGQRFSTIKGIEAVTGDDFAIIPGDLPLLEKSDINGTADLLGKYSIARAMHAGTPGHPVVFRKEHREGILKSGISFKEYLSLFDVGLYEGSVGCCYDTDTPERYKELIASY